MKAAVNAASGRGFLVELAIVRPNISFREG